ncbi:nucleotidyltransferase domain-containing protein [Halosimplex rubrum]|uniref:Nucleotidyltransferase domain-containing protein n=1 Tax=Halosimplex rubrum TaxID=869889 RepID=A0A7D5TKP2_9EURY|nr:nucleotidyltransferase domain-containing protein [Halosimplex rubrum]QLH76812.1 nucleotidyltransferase domain-containing protein [Halosimplex rubrum]
MAKSGNPELPGVDLDGMREYLAQTDVIFAVLFGSHARGTPTDSSDIDIALRFPDDMDDYERFKRRNRIDATLQQYASGFVDVSNIDDLPNHVAHAALRDGIPIVGDEQAIENYEERIAAEYERDRSEREQERRAFIDRLARGDV